MIQHEDAKRNADVKAADRIALNFFLVGLSPSVSGRPIPECPFAFVPDPPTASFERSSLSMEVCRRSIVKTG